MNAGTLDIQGPGAGAPAPAPAPGLSIGHNSPSASFVAYQGSSYCKITIPSRLRSQPKGGATKRGKILRFTRKSRKRLLDTVAKLRQDSLPLMVTLTYPLQYPIEQEIWHVHLDNFLKRFLRAYPNASGLWRLEPQERGAPHFHLLAYGLNADLMDSLQEWVSRNWYEVVESGDPSHLEAGAQTARIRSHKGAMSYAAKYCAKESGFELVGRHWGMFNRKKLPMGEEVRLSISPKDGAKIRRCMHRSIKEVTRHEKRAVGKTLRFDHGFPYLEDEIAVCFWKERRPNWKRLKSISTIYGDPAQWLRLARYCLTAPFSTLPPPLQPITTISPLANTTPITEPVKRFSSRFSVEEEIERALLFMKPLAERAPHHGIIDRTSEIADLRERIAIDSPAPLEEVKPPSEVAGGFTGEEVGACEAEPF